jgi:hypothetical protein
LQKPCPVATVPNLFRVSGTVAPEQGKFPSRCPIPLPLLGKPMELGTGIINTFGTTYVSTAKQFAYTTSDDLETILVCEIK